MNAELVAFGMGAMAIAIGLLYATRRLYPRLDLPEEALSSVRLLTATIVGLLAVLGIGLVVVGVLS